MQLVRQDRNVKRGAHLAHLRFGFGRLDEEDVCVNPWAPGSIDAATTRTLAADLLAAADEIDQIDRGAL
jgi:hypothetical protein